MVSHQVAGSLADSDDALEQGGLGRFGTVQLNDCGDLLVFSQVHAATGGDRAPG